MGIWFSVPSELLLTKVSITWLFLKVNVKKFENKCEKPRFVSCQSAASKLHIDSKQPSYDFLNVSVANVNTETIFHSL